LRGTRQVYGFNALINGALEKVVSNNSNET
jgi:urease beta subunit